MKKCWLVTIRILGDKEPDVRTLCGDTIFVRLDEGQQSATWTLKRVPNPWAKKKREPRA